MMTSIEKFGGSSMAWPATVAERIGRDDPFIVVASAPGRDSGDKTNGAKMTDLFRDNKIGEAFDRAEEVAGRSGLSPSDQAAAMDVLRKWIQRHESDTWARAAGGEQFSAELLARMTDRTVLDPLEMIYINPDRTPDIARSVHALQRALLDPNARYVLPGFYGQAGEQSGASIRTMERGGSDTTGALAAAAFRLPYVNLSDVSGVYSGDPHHYSEAVVRDIITYNESRAFAFFGNEVLHPEVTRVLGKTGIDTMVGSVHELVPRTRVTSSRDEVLYDYVGVSSRDVWQIGIHKTGMDTQAGVAHKVYDTLSENNISYLSSHDGPDRISLLLPNGGESDPDKVMDFLNERTSDLEISLHSAALVGVVLTGRQPYMKSVAAVAGSVGSVAPQAVAVGDVMRQEVGVVVARDERQAVEEVLHEMVVDGKIA